MISPYAPQQTPSRIPTPREARDAARNRSQAEFTRSADRTARVVRRQERRELQLENLPEEPALVPVIRKMGKSSEKKLSAYYGMLKLIN